MSANIQAILDKIAAMQAIAAEGSGATEEERDTAMRLITGLMLKYNIDSSKVDAANGSKQTVNEDMFVNKSFKKRWTEIVMSCATRLNYCRHTLAPGKGVFFIVGRKENIEAAKATSEYIREQIRALAYEYIKKEFMRDGKYTIPSAKRGTEWFNFAEACALRTLERVNEILEELRNDDAKAIEFVGTNALIVASAMDQLTKEAEDFIAAKNVRTVKRKKLLRGDAAKAGWKAGDRVSINRKVG